MTKKIYKYAGPTTIEKMFSTPKQVTLKCSYPKDFNDPYELFLTINFNTDPNILAFYADAIGKIPQYPTTCFSRSPIVTPMWAHYAQTLEGIAIEFDEELLQEKFKESTFDDIKYLTEPDPDLTHALHNAYTTQKPRHMFFFQSGVMSTAYFSKSASWNYEQERRMVLDPNEIRTSGDIMLMDVPAECITSLICGPRANMETKNLVKEKAQQIGCKYYEMHIGRSSIDPYFMTKHGETYIFDNTSIEPCQNYCHACREPSQSGDENCSWCQIDSSHRINAATKNPYRLLESHGLLEGYIKNALDIARRHKR